MTAGRFLRITSPAVFLSWLALTFLAVSHVAAADVPGQQWAVLIAVGKHADPADNLSYTVRDAQLLRQVLTERAGIAGENILVMTDVEPEARRPILANLRREVPEFLARAGKQDRVLVFFSGHGFLQGGKSFLVPADCRRDKLLETALPAAELRQALADCKGSVKFLILDCCHSGGAKAPGRAEPAAETVARAMAAEPTDGCLILASCRADQLSWEWAERKQGVFTYWLARALEGGADKDGNGQVTADEVYDYTQERVRTTVAQVFAGEQSPVRIIGGDIEGVPVLFTLRPEPPETLCRRLAEHLDLEIRRRKLKKVGVLEFLQPVGRTEGLAAANLPAYCAATVRQALTQLASGGYEVLGEGVSKEFRVEDVGDPAAMQRLGQRAGGMDGVITGTLRRRGPNMHVLCDLIATSDGSSLATPGGLFPLSETLVLDDRSADTRRRPPGDPYAPQVVAHAQEQSRLGHPLLNPSFPFRIEVWSIRPKPGESIGPRTPRVKKDLLNLSADRDAGAAEPAPRQLLVPAREGEWFEIRAENRSGQTVLMTLLVDGLNTLGQRRERLGQGWSWTLEPGKTYAVDGWWDPKRPEARPGQLEDFTVRRFRFTDVAESLAGRQGFGESIGLITAGFYSVRTGRAVGVGAGPAEIRQQRTTGFLPGEQLGVVQVRYVDERELKDR